MRKQFSLCLILLFYLPCQAQKGECEFKMYPAPALSDSLKKVFENNLKSAERKYLNDSTEDINIIWYGRRLAYMGNYKEAIEVYTKGIQLHPTNARFYRHRGHRYITIRCFDKAVEDLKKAADLVKGQIDEVEADGIPNAMNIPLSTLQTNIWYHLGLAYYLKGEFKSAMEAYETCLQLCENDDMKVATLNWLNITLLKMGKKKEAAERLKYISEILEIIENQDYLEIVLMYAGNNDNQVKERMEEQAPATDATLGYGLGTYYLFHGQKAKAKEIYEKVVSGKQWASFGFIAAEEELKKLK